MKIKNFRIHQVRKYALMEFLSTFVEKAGQCPTVVNELATWYGRLKADFDEAQRIERITMKSPLTQLFELCDRQRNGILVGIRHVVMSFEKSTEGREKEAARLLMTGLSSMKVDPNGTYQEQTGDIDNLLHFLMVQQQWAVETLRIGELVKQLNVVNNRMHELVEGRVKEIEDKGKGAFARARTAVEKSYRSFTDAVNSWANLNEGRLNEGASDDGSSLSLARFIEWTNADTECYRPTRRKQTAETAES